MIRAIAVAALWPLLTAGACATTAEPVVRTVRVEVPVPVTCVPKGLGEPPAYPDEDGALRAAPGAADRMMLLAAGRLLRKQRLSELEPILSACR